MSQVTSVVRKLDERIARYVNRQDLKISLFGFFFLGTFIWLYQMSTQFPRRPGVFPQLVLGIGIVLAIAIVLKRLLTKTVFSGLFLKSEDGVDEYLSGGDSKLTRRQKLVRMTLLIIWISTFFVLGGTNIFIALTVTYAGMVISFGPRDLKGVIGSTVAMNIFVYIVFVRVLNVPIGVF
jgi:hypothetical protein